MTTSSTDFKITFVNNLLFLDSKKLYTYEKNSSRKNKPWMKILKNDIELFTNSYIENLISMENKFQTFDKIPPDF